MYSPPPLHPSLHAGLQFRSVNFQDVKDGKSEAESFGTLCSCHVRTPNETEMESGSRGRQMALG